MQSNYVNKKFILFTGLIAVALCALPIMSMQLSGGESGKIVIYGYDLIEFSAWGCLPLLTPMLLPVIQFCLLVISYVASIVVTQLKHG